MLPTSLEAATERMMRPESIAREKSMFGDVFVEHVRFGFLPVLNRCVDLSFLSTAELGSMKLRYGTRQSRTGKVSL